MAKKKQSTRKTSKTVRGRTAKAKRPVKKKANTSDRPRKRSTKKVEIVVMDPDTATLIPTRRRNSLRAWFALYLGIEEGLPNDDAPRSHTFKAKKSDLQRFIEFVERTSGTDHPDGWTKSVSKAFLRHFMKAKSERTGRTYAPTTIDRVLATLRHAARWIHKQRPFLAGYPMEGIKGVGNAKTPWFGIKDIEITRMLSAAEQLIQIQTRANQTPRRNYALLVVGLDTALRPFEMLGLDFRQYDGKCLRKVVCKGKYVEDKVALSKFAREALDDYIQYERDRRAGPLFPSKNGNPLPIQNYDVALKAIAAQANARLPKKQHIHVSPHMLRHTSLRRMCEKHGVQYAKQRAHHVSDRYIWRYVQPTDEDFESAVEGFWD